MDYHSISATELKRKISEVLTDVSYKSKITIVERYGKPIAKIIPYKEGVDKKKDIGNILNSYFGSIPDFPEVLKKRKFRKKDILL